MKLNLGCGQDIKPGYTNVDFRELPGAEKVDLSKLPWPWASESADEILMLDFLEHFPYRNTVTILQEAWRVLKKNGRLEVQVPDFTHCSKVILNIRPFMCNRCGWEFIDNHSQICGKCGQNLTKIAEAAVHRLFGGQDYEGNFHNTAFTEDILMLMLSENGFEDISFVKYNENGETMWANWNFKFVAKKGEITW